ncbi:hypothetical protein ILYODFUR_013632 [Ilyodon furcidens]|uniref:Uncharacterized protein n=1 Tax=Ilyodon furcidens TaxID=33524 RepID=A0ABV0UGA0_9TELE
MGAEQTETRLGAPCLSAQQSCCCYHICCAIWILPSHTPTSSHPPSLAYLIFLFTCGSLQQLGSLLVRRTKMEGMEERMDGVGGGGKQSVSFWRVSAAHMLSKES